jgi:hypothetical protein
MSLQLITELEALDQLPQDLLEKVRAIPQEGSSTTSRSSAVDLIKSLAQTFCPAKVAEVGPIQRTWELVGLVYKSNRRFAEALDTFRQLYDHMLVAQEESDKRYSKGMPLVWMSECYSALGYPFTAHRHLMLTLVEDAINGGGEVTRETGSYPRLVWSGLLSEVELQRYAREAQGRYLSHQSEALYPEWVLQELDRDWITQAPTPQEAAVFAANSRYLDRLVSRLGDKTGKTLEAIADYVMSCMPGCRTARRRTSLSTDYDIVCSMEGIETDFRSELGRYFVCECKDMQKAAITDLTKFCYVLDSLKSRFGILFSKHGISGEGTTQYAAREQLKVFQNRGIVIVVIDKEDLDRLSKGTNFISLLRRKYEEVRLDLAGTT